MHINQTMFKGRDHQQIDGPCALDFRQRITSRESIENYDT
jgi:hypothetical protein